MKKSAIMLASAAVALMAASCAGNESKSNDSKSSDAQSAAVSSKSDDVIYSGLLPAADAAGIQYILKLDYSDSDKGVKGDYDLYQVYLMSDSAVVGAQKNVVNASEGDFSGFDKDGKSYLKLEGTSPLYFLVDSDSTLTLVNSDLEVATGDLNYTLNKVQ